MIENQIGEGMHIRFFGEFRNCLGESPLWDPRAQCLWWVDVVANKLMAARADGVLVFEKQFDLPVTSIGLAVEGLVASMADGFALISNDGVVSYLDRPAIGGDGIRFNDGKLDRAGRFIAGTMQVDTAAEAQGTLWQLGLQAAAKKVEEGVRISNATCFSVDGDCMYFADSLEGILRRYPYEKKTGELGRPGVLVDLKMYNSVPDGATVDSDGCIWVALVQAQAIACFTPDGVLKQMIDLPIPFPSCPAFGGEDYATLYITSISDSGHRLKTEHPDGGRIIQIDGLAARGVPEGVFRGLGLKESAI